MIRNVMSRRAVCLGGASTLAMLARAQRATAQDVSPAASPASINATYLGHGARMLLQIPAAWQPLPIMLDAYGGDDGYIWVTTLFGETFDQAIDMGLIVAGVFVTGEAQEIQVDGQPARLFRSARMPMVKDPCIVVVVELTEPFMVFDGTFGYGLIVGDRAHFADILKSVTFDTSTVTVEMYLDSVLDIVSANAVVGERLDIDTLRADAAGITRMDDAHAWLESDLTSALGAAGDHHTSVMSPTSKTGDSALPEATSEHAGPKMGVPTGERLADSIGYISIPGTVDIALDACFDAGRIAVQTLANEDVTGWVIDLRDNRGGHIITMIATLFPFLTRRGVYGQAYPGQRPDILPYTRMKSTIEDIGMLYDAPALDDVPMAFILGEWTASSGELLCMSFIGRPNTRTFGAHTYGATTINVPMFLYDDWILNLSIAWMTDGEGQNYPDGITPDETVGDPHQWATSDPADPAIAAAIDWLGEGASTPVASPAS